MAKQATVHSILSRKKGVYNGQRIKDLRSFIGDHDLDRFFNDCELIAITTDIDHDLFIFFLTSVTII